MAVALETPSVVFAGNGSTAVGYDIPFSFSDAAHVKVIVTTSAGVATPLGSSAFGVSGTPAKVFTATAYDSTHKVTIYRETPATQDTIYPESGPFPAKSHEAALDKLTRLLQEQLTRSDRSMRLAPGYALDDVVPKESSVFGFDSALKPWTKNAAELLAWLGIATTGLAATIPVFSTASEREDATATVAGRLAVQIDDLSVWMSVYTPGPIYRYLHLVSSGPQFFTDALTRQEAAPAVVGQLGIQSDDLSIWQAYGTLAGQWRVVVDAAGRPAAHDHAAGDIHSLPVHAPRAVDRLGFPLSDDGGRFARWGSINLMLDLAKVRRSGRNLVLALSDAGITPTVTQLAAIDTFFAYVDSSGLVTANSAKSRLLVPVWTTLAPNLIDWLHPEADVQPTALRFDGGAGTPAFSMPGGSIASVTADANAAGVINLQSKISEAWTAANWCWAYYSHSAPVGPNSSMLGGRNDAESGGAYRYFSTIYDGTGSPANNCVFSPGFTSGTSSAFSHGGNALGLVLAGMHDTNKYRVRQREAAGLVGGSTTDASGSSNQAIISPLSQYALAYYPAAAAHGQPASLLYSGYLPGTTATHTDDFTAALFTLATALGATSV